MIKGFKNVNVLIENEGIVKKTILVENGKITKILDECDCEELITLDDSKIVVPGFIDKHVHGGNNSDGMYSSLEDAKNIAKTIAAEGVTSYGIPARTSWVTLRINYFLREIVAVWYYTILGGL